MVDVNQSLLETSVDVVKKLCFCEHCGFCRSVCPVLDVVNYEESVGPRGRKTLFLAFSQGLLKPTVKLSEKFYMCCICSSCAIKCPQAINIGDVSLIVRQKLFELGTVPEVVKKLTDNIIEFKNIYTMENSCRHDWAMYTGSDIKIKDSAEVLYFVGCVTSFSGMAQTIAQAITSILNYLNEDWTVLNDEWCCGHPLILAGAVKEAREVALHDVKAMESIGPKRVITGCPGCYLALKYEWPRLIGRRPSFEVYHFVEYLNEQITKERLRIPKMDMKITFHDPCELAKICGVVNEPRNVLNSFANVVYPANSGKNSYCCGGGGLVKATYPSITSEISKIRYKMLMFTNAKVIVSACPTCILNLLQALQSIQNGIKVIDISQFVTEQLELM